MVRYSGCDVLDSVTADRLDRHTLIPYICPLVITRIRWLILKHLTPSPSRPTHAVHSDICGLGSSISFVNTDIAMSS